MLIHQADIASGPVVQIHFVVTASQGENRLKGVEDGLIQVLTLALAQVHKRAARV